MTNDDPTTEALIEQGILMGSAGRWEEALPVFQELLRRGHKPAVTTQSIGTAQMGLGLFDEAVETYRRALAMDPLLRSAHDNLIMLLDCHPTTTPALAQAERTAWWEKFGKAAYEAAEPHTNDPDPHKRLRVAYLSCDYRFHSAVMAFLPVIDHHTDRIERVLYSTLPPAFYDTVTKEIREKAGPAFVDVHQYNGEGIAKICRLDQIDILVDLGGYTGGNRLPAFAHRAAPVQVSAWGYATGVGWPGVVLFSDAMVATPETRAQMQERVIDLPCVITYEPRPDLPEANELPCLTGAPVFGVFQRSMKVNRETCRVWAEILRRVPEARICFKGPQYFPQMRDWMRVEFGDELFDRCDFAYSTDQRDHMLWYQYIDLALDPWPQCGGVSTMEALWMGVPVLTLRGERIIQNTSSSILKTCGLSQFITSDTETYIQRAVDMVTTRKAELAWLRGLTRRRLRASPIMNGYLDHVERAYRKLWTEWCQTARAQAA